MVVVGAAVVVVVVGGGDGMYVVVAVGADVDVVAGFSVVGPEGLVVSEDVHVFKCGRRTGKRRN